MKSKLLTFLAFLLGCSTSFGQKVQDLNVKYMLRGHIYVQSIIWDSMSIGGFGTSDNLPKQRADTLPFSGDGLFLKIDTSQLVPMGGKYNHYPFFIINQSDTTAVLTASDSRIDAIAEVLYKGKWRPIEYLPVSWCAHSHHHVYLEPGEYWHLYIPKFAGKIKTKLRYRLMLGRGKSIYSNEIPTAINKKQMDNKQGHAPDGFMDPYLD